MNQIRSRGYRLNSRGSYRTYKYNPKYYIGQCKICLDTFSVYIDMFEGIEMLPSTYFEYISTQKDKFRFWQNNNNLNISLDVIKDGDLFHKCGGNIKLWVMKK